MKNHNILYDLRQKLINIGNFQKTLLKGKDDDSIIQNKNYFNKVLDLYLHYSYKYLKSRK